MPSRQAVLALTAAALAGCAPKAPDNTVAPNDNRAPAGTMSGKTLTVALEAREGVWFPEGPRGKGLHVAAFAEAGKAMQSPGPLIRVPVGTTVHTSFHNTLTRPLVISGLSDTRGPADTTAVLPGASHDFTFVANKPGTYYYNAAGRAHNIFGDRAETEMQLAGAIVVDSAGAAATPADRIFVLSWWYTVDSTSPTGLGSGTMAINGLSWPHTEHLTYEQNDSVHWRVINVTAVDHPMHLHGFYFRVNGHGDGNVDTTYTADQQRLAVTEFLDAGQTMEMAWLPSRAGNWIWHCHFAGHISDDASLDKVRGTMDTMGMAQHVSDRPHEMYGLVMGITVTPKGAQVGDSRTPRPIRLELTETPHTFGAFAAYTFALNGNKPAAPGTPGPTLFLTRNERVAITVVNHTQEGAAVHWHGIELESPADGVPSWSGSGKELFPMVQPGDSYTVTFSPPRAGTFMYHSHMNESHEIAAGLAGAIIVLDSGTVFNPSTDRILLVSPAGPTANQTFGPFAPLQFNGEQHPAPIAMQVGTTYRLRFLSVAELPTTLGFTLRGDSIPLAWRAVAKDGAALPASQATMRPATLHFDPGEIYDFEYTPTRTGTYTISAAPPKAPPPFQFGPVITLPVVVK